MTRTVWAMLMFFVATPLALAAEHASWDEYMKANRYKCPGPLDTLRTPRTLTLAGKTYKHSGSRLEVQNADADGVVRIGVVSAIKDVAPGTKQNLSAALEWFKAQGPGYQTRINSVLRAFRDASA